MRISENSFYEEVSASVYTNDFSSMLYLFHGSYSYEMDIEWYRLQIGEKFVTIFGYELIDVPDQ